MSSTTTKTKSPNILQRIQYRLFGPTTFHLQFEFIMLCCSMLLTIGSMSALYKSSFPKYPGDVIYLLLTLCVLSRHIIFRLLCTWDPTTHSKPNIFGIISHFIQSYIIGGQVYDRPPALQQLTQQNTSSNNTANPSAIDRMLQLTGGTIISDPTTIASITHLIPSTLIYAWQIPRQYIIFPFNRLFQRRQYDDEIHNTHPRDRNRRSITEPTSRWSQSLQNIKQTVIQLWITHGPSLQFFCTSIILGYYLCRFYEYRLGRSPWNIIFGDEQSFALLAVNSQAASGGYRPYNSEKDKNRPYGSYKYMDKPPEYDIIVMMMAFGTLYSVFLFSRLMLPIPDLVAGGNVVRDIRTEARAAALTNNAISNSGIGVGSGISSVGKNNSFITLFIIQLKEFFNWSSNPSASDTAPWTEKQKPITSENRLQLSLAILLLRVLENIFIVAILPRTYYICRATGHCPSTQPIWEISKFIHPIGINEAKRTDGFNIFGFMESDIISAIWVLFGSAILTLTLQSTELLVLNRTYLSILGFLSSEWEPYDPIKSQQQQQQQTTTISDATTTGGGGGVGPSIINSNSIDPPVWEPRRKYKKGDLVYYPNAASGEIYQATSNSPEGRPCERELRGFNDILRKELGHPSTSELLSHIATIQVCVTVMHWIAGLFLLFFSDKRNAQGFIWFLMAHTLAARGVLARDLAAIKTPSKADSIVELRQLGKEIMSGN